MHNLLSYLYLPILIALHVKSKNNIDPNIFVRNPNKADLLGSWLRIFKKDTSTIFTFKDDNILEIREIHTGKQVSGHYVFNPNNQPMSLDIVSDKGNVLPTICIFDNTDKLRLAGPKNGQRRNRFTAFGDNFFLTRDTLKPK